jgi:UDP-glucose 4-epimerase
VVNAVIGLVETPAAHGAVYNIGSDFPVTILQLAQEIIQRVDPSVKVEFMPYREAYGDDFEDVRRRVPDVSRLEKMLGQKPTMTLGAILDDIIRWKREQLQLRGNQ